MPFRSTAGQRTQGGDIIGMAKFQRSLHALDTTELVKALSKASRSALAPIVKEMKAQAFPHSQTISDAIGSRVKIYKRDKYVVGLVGIKNDPSVRQPYIGNERRGMHDPRFTFHLVDLGTKPHGGKAYGKGYFLHPGTEPEHIREVALELTQSKVSRVYERALVKAVDKLIDGA